MPIVRSFVAAAVLMLTIAAAAAQTPAKPAAPAATPAAPAASPSAPAVAPSASGTPGPGQVWVNAGTKKYHCAGSRSYGKTKKGSYMTEAAAKASGATAAGGKACGKS